MPVDPGPREAGRGSRARSLRGRLGGRLRGEQLPRSREPQGSGALTSASLGGRVPGSPRGSPECWARSSRCATAVRPRPVPDRPWAARRSGGGCGCGSGERSGGSRDPPGRECPHGHTDPPRGDPVARFAHRLGLLSLARFSRSGSYSAAGRRLHAGSSAGPYLRDLREIVDLRLEGHRDRRPGRR